MDNGQGMGNKNVDARLTLDEDEVVETFVSNDNVIQLFQELTNE